MVPPREETLNQMFETLADWNSVLEHRKTEKIQAAKNFDSEQQFSAPEP